MEICKMSTFVCAALVVVVAVSCAVFLIRQTPDMPRVDLNRWWGKGQKQEREDTSVRPFKVEFSDSMVNNLKQRLKNRRDFTKPLEGIQSEYGINTDYLNEVLDYWQDKYDFKERAEMLNRLPHFKTKIQGLEIHFIHARPNIAKDTGRDLKVLPILLLHGWPSSSKEFDKMIPLLTTPREGYDFVYEVVAADLPGYGFSEGSNKPGLNPVHIGVIMRNLMHRLGYDHYYIQAGDWGSQCGMHLATLFPNEVLGFHSNMPLSSMPISNIKLLLGSLYPPLLGDAEHLKRIYPLKSFFSYLIRETGYFHIQATKPDTLGVGLTDSPAGLAAYLIEKTAVYTNRDQLNTPHGGLEALDLNDVLDTITIMWVNSCATTSMRLYAEAFSPSSPEIRTLQRIPTIVPFAAINFLYEFMYHPDSVLKDKYPNLVHSTTINYGGHFAAMENPTIMADDVFAATVAFHKFHSKKL